MSSKTSDNKTFSEETKPKTIHFRPQKWFKELVETTMKEQKIKTVTEAMHFLLKELGILREQKEMKLATIKSAFPLCEFLIYVPQEDRYECINRKPLVRLTKPLIPQVCKVCKNITIVEKATVSKRKTVPNNVKRQTKRTKHKRWENYSEWFDPTQPYFG